MSVYDGVVYPGRSVYVSSAGPPIGLAPKEGISATEYSFKNLSTVRNNFVKRNLEAGAPGAVCCIGPWVAFSFLSAPREAAGQANTNPPPSRP